LGGSPLAEAPDSLPELYAKHSTSEAGLTGPEAARRLLKWGPNDPGGQARSGPLREFLRFFANPLVLILLSAAVVSAILGEAADAAIIVAIIVVSTILNFFQAYRSEQAVLSLRERVAPTASVLRDGAWTEIARREVVDGDIIALSAGDMVPADARLITCRDLHVQQAALTGESAPVEKSAVGAPRFAESGDFPDSVFLGTSVVSGTATALVVATGAATQFGDVAMRLAARPPETEFDRGTRQFSILILKTVTFLVLFILLVNLAVHRNALESLLFAVALAVGLTPEFLPMITTVTLSMGAVRMARKHVIVKRLDAIENFGSIDILCSDKTGTLTAGALTLEHLLDPFGEPADRAFALAFINSSFETGIRSPLDAAILARPGASADGYIKTDEIPFDFERRRLSIAARTADMTMLISKGAPESILPVCSSYETRGEVRALDPAALERCEQAFRTLSAKGFRMLAVAWRRLEASAALTTADERAMTLVGFLAFSDPPRADVAGSLARLRRDGVHVKILTGDNELVTRDVCTRVGINARQIVMGQDLERLGDAALGAVAERVDVFARLSPGQKNRIIRALKSRGHVVGFLGDGINDAPSLHAADVGISVAGAVDVAREAAAIILLEPGLHVIHNGILEGRKAFGNLLKYLLMGTSSNFGNMFSMAAASLFLPFLPMMPTQILLNNFLYDLAQVTIPTDNVDPEYVRKPQRWNIGIIRDFMIFIGPLSSIFDFLTFFVMLRIFAASEAMFHTGWFVESLATQTLVLFVIRTVGNPWSNRPSAPLAVTTILAVMVGVILPYSPLAEALGLVALPAAFYAFLAAATITYLVLVQIVKQRLMARLLAGRKRGAPRRARTVPGSAAVGAGPDRSKSQSKAP
jgi:P-type Mg2+ transporter